MKKIILPPAKIYKDLFTTVHQNRIFKDAKRFTDATPKAKSEFILSEFAKLEKIDKATLLDFVNKYFEVKETENNDYKSDTSLSVEEHLHSLWPLLSRQKDPVIEGDSLIALPHPYVVPGGRFNEIYYWDSFFTMLGLKVSGEIEMIQSMVDNFAYLIEEIGHIPNGNRTYFAGRSQPPFFACMVTLLADIKGDEIYLKYLSVLEKEYGFWMKGSEILTTEYPENQRVVRVKEDTILNRYWDDFPTARDEMYPDDMDLLEESGRSEESLFRDVRAACESGWDFSSRWLKDPNDLKTIDATSILPVDLNCLMYNLEQTIAFAYSLDKKEAKAKEFNQKAVHRKKAIQAFLWSEKEDFYFDYNIKTKERTGVYSAAATFPLYFKIANGTQAEKVSVVIENKFLKPGGLVTTPYTTGQQWDAPNGWAPLQYMAVIGLQNYQKHALAKEITTRWLALNEKVFANTGKMMEKYNVEDDTLHAGGGEYDVQDGFGWTNGVYLALKKL